MKTRNTLLAAAFVCLFAGPAFAANDADIDQTGNFLEATANQTGVDNLADIIQVGDNHSATVDQVGDNNIAAITQDTAGKGASGAIVQTGDRNTAQSYYLDGNKPGVQVGITQTGNDNEAYQNLDNLWGNASGSAYVTQEGNENYARQDQITWGGGQVLAATITQLGDGNEAYQSQEGSGGDFTSTISQQGSYNYASVSQTGTNSPGAVGDVSQLGDNNSATIVQSH